MMGNVLGILAGVLALVQFAPYVPGASLWMSAAQGLGNLTILVLSLRFGVGGYTRRDIAALILAGIGLVIWGVTREPTTALFISIAVDAIGASLTIIKAHRDPASETMSTWVLSDLSGLFAALAVGRASVPLLAYPVYVSIANSTVIGGMIIGRRRLRRVGPSATREPDEVVL